MPIGLYISAKVEIGAIYGFVGFVNANLLDKLCRAYFSRTDKQYTQVDQTNYTE